MAFTDPGGVTIHGVADPVWGNNVRADLVDHEARIVTLETKPPVWCGNVATTQNVTTAVDTDVSWATVVDIGGFTSSNPDTTLVIPKTGMYTIHGEVYFSASAAGSARVLRMFVGANALTDDARLPTGSNVEIKQPKFAMTWPFTLGDVIKFQVWQDSGSTLTIGPGLFAPIKSRASIMYRGPSS